MGTLAPEKERTEAGDRPLAPSDRCDSCGSQARLRVTLSTGEIMLCQHHGNRYLPAMKSRDLVLAVRDERDFAVGG